jgi:Fe-S-cluster containining protein
MPYNDTNLCFDCPAYCCDGTLYPNVFLTPDFDSNEDYLKTFKQHLWSSVQSDRHNIRPGIYMNQPCTALNEEKNCSVYISRPTTCKCHDCKVLSRYKRGELKYEEAKLILKKVSLTKKDSKERKEIINQEFK